MTSDTRTTVMLVDDHQVMRDLLRDALEDTGEYEVVAQAADGAEALRMVRRGRSRRDRDGRDNAGYGRHRGLPGDHGPAARYQGADADGLHRE